ncbi:phosphoribosylformylglycinamidine synthase subunit PurS [Helicobacter winghamensis]|uniref:Phosphoribosylformylglycinamidine synthase subunit PurS n=1 Tax=Helicobacter winghamensis TaxID=157268 RepID=A0A2N3PJQ7_9HELI|nr:phosphoribosylformylglycinamidine synthase subunit PurS [Helicobacter winghamensis]EEO26248.1 phosphoribosylformylglycinamidine synthase, purS protein [Helicobacter winghamensis ATCC BAA-430]PKT77242.1 phosphoribosylformylglycinamidine synthase [Helicobacter winghamensis]PKT77442.1 phosphoribosylformylglycinamidine synthase [Helicobacter winghamensis]PKT77825.1 phosphoribosylformylglycinamidine synthase [Helicobacter winghamensis]PKT81408.1 phosphoribosylformylglycinamidine synthase [Helico
MQVEVIVELKDGVLDPQGKAIHHALESLDFKGVNGVKTGKIIKLDIDNSNKEAVKKEVESMCEMLLANTVIENYTIKM